MSEENNGQGEAEKKDTAAAGGNDGDNKSSEGFSLIDENAEAPKEGERPGYLPENAWDEEKKAPKADVLLSEYERSQKRVTDLLAKLGKGEHKPPAKPEDYKLPEFKDEADKGAADLLKSDSAFVKNLAGVAHKAGLGQVQFETFMGEAAKLLAAATGEKKGDEPLTAEEKEQIREDIYKEIGPNAPRLHAAVNGFVKMLKDQGKFSEGELAEIKAMGASAAGLTALNKLRTMTGGESIPIDAQHIDGLPSDQEIFTFMGQKAYNDPSDPGHLEAHKKVDGWLKGREAAGRPATLQV